MNQIQHDCFVIDGVKIPFPDGKHALNTTIINDKIYCDGYEYKDGKWKRTLKAFLHLVFG